MRQKKKVIPTAASLQEISDSATNAFKTIVARLKAANEEAEFAKAANIEQIAALQAENEAIEILSEKNNKIVQNIENLLVV